MSQVNLVAMDEFSEATEFNYGWCTNCKEFCGECCEPDAENYECPVCGENTCYGAEQALILGLIDFS